MTDSPYEKTGNANWAQCPECDHWFHVASSLIRMETVDLICPDCGATFKPTDAKALLSN